MRRIIRAALIAITPIAAVFAIAEPASAHTADAYATCNGVVGTAERYGNFDNVATMKIDGTNVSGSPFTFHDTWSHTAPVPQDGQSHTWEVDTRTEFSNPAYHFNFSGTVGPCGTPPTTLPPTLPPTTPPETTLPPTTVPATTTPETPPSTSPSTTSPSTTTPETTQPTPSTSEPSTSTSTTTPPSSSSSVPSSTTTPTSGPPSSDGPKTTPPRDAPPTGGQSLPRTGTPIAPIVALGLAALTTGGLLVRKARR